MNCPGGKEEAGIMSNKSDFRQLMSNREELYRFFARLFEKEIDEAFYTQLREVKFPMDREETQLTEFSDALLRLNEYFEYDAGETLDDLAADYAKTFLGAGIAEGHAAFPYESVYTSPKRIMMQNAWSEVSDIYMNKGIEISDEAKFTVAELIDFGNYLLSDKRKQTIESAENLNVVGDWDVQNWIDTPRDIE